MVKSSREKEVGIVTKNKNCKTKTKIAEECIAKQKNRDSHGRKKQLIDRV